MKKCAALAALLDGQLEKSMVRAPHSWGGGDSDPLFSNCPMNEFGKLSQPTLVTTLDKRLVGGLCPPQPPGEIFGFPRLEISMAGKAKVKTKFLQIRIDPDLKELWKKNADDLGVSVTDLLVQAMDLVKPWRPQARPNPEDRDIERAKIRELARIGNNLNQISRWCNTYKSSCDATLILQHLVSIEHELKKVLG